MMRIPFLKPNVVQTDQYLTYLKKIDETKVYSNFGPLNELFQDRVLSQYFNNKGAVVTVNNATTGLILSISQLKRPKGKYALMPSFTFSATPLAATWCGLEPYFIDIDKDTWCMDKAQLDYAIKLLGDDVAVVIPYATFGTFLEIEYYQELQNSGIPVVIDAAASFGTTLDGIHFAQNFDGAVVFSFHATKSFGIGEGGMVYSNNTELIRNVRVSSNFGYNGKRESEIFGLNGKMSELYAGIALATLDMYQSKKTSRINVYDNYVKEFEMNHLFTNGWKLQNTTGDIAYQFFTVLSPKFTDSIEFVKKLEDQNIQAVTYFNPACHKQYQFKDCSYLDLKVTNEISSRVISLPFWEDMDISTIKRVVETLI